MISEVSIPRGILRDVKAISGGGFIAVGEYTHADDMVDGLIVIGDDHGQISNLCRFKHATDSMQSLFIRNIMEMSSTTFILLGESSAFGRARTVLAVLDIYEYSIRRAHYLGEDGPSIRTYGQRVYKSVHGGYTVVGYRRTQLSTYDYFLAELTKNFELPGVGLFMEMVENEFILERLNVELYTGSLIFFVADVSGFKTTELLRSVYNELSVSVNSFPVLNRCFVEPVTPKPTLNGPTSTPSTVMPSVQPTVHPSARTRPSYAPGTSCPAEFGVANPPTAAPTEFSTMSPTGTPVTVFPIREPATSSPSSCPITRRPTIIDGDSSGSTEHDNGLFVGSISTIAVIGFAMCCSLCYFAYEKYSFRFHRGRSGEILRRSHRDKNPTQPAGTQTQLIANDFSEKILYGVLAGVVATTHHIIDQMNGDAVESYKIDAMGAELNSPIPIMSVDEFFCPLSDDEDVML